MAAKKSDKSDAPSPERTDTGNAEVIAARQKARDEATNQMGVEPPPVDPQAGVNPNAGVTT